MKAIPNKNLSPITFVKCCRNCHMVVIRETKPTICPSCGSFYESNEPKYSNLMTKNLVK